MEAIAQTHAVGRRGDFWTPPASRQKRRVRLWSEPNTPEDSPLPSRPLRVGYLVRKTALLRLRTGMHVVRILCEKLDSER